MEKELRLNAGRVFSIDQAGMPRKNIGETRLVLFFECVVEHPVRNCRVVCDSELKSRVENGSSEGVRFSGNGLGWLFVGTEPGAGGLGGVEIWIGHGGGKKRKARCAPRRRRKDKA